MTDQKKKTTLSIEFDNQKALEHFVTWLSLSGEKDYYIWMLEREMEDEEDISVQFIYPSKKKKSTSNTILTKPIRFSEK